MKENKYETVFLLRPDLTDEGLKKVNDKIHEIITRSQGQVTQLKDLGRRPLAYRIAKQMKGHYFQLNYLGNGQVVQELERHLRLSEESLRFLTVKDEIPPPQEHQVIAPVAGESTAAPTAGKPAQEANV